MNESSKWLEDLANEIHPMGYIHPSGVWKKASKLCAIAIEIERLQARVEELEKAAKFAQAVLWGSDGDKKGAIKYLDKALQEQHSD